MHVLQSTALCFRRLAHVITGHQTSCILENKSKFTIRNGKHKCVHEQKWRTRVSLEQKMGTTSEFMGKQREQKIAQRHTDTDTDQPRNVRSRLRTVVRNVF